MIKKFIKTTTIIAVITSLLLSSVNLSFASTPTINSNTKKITISSSEINSLVTEMKQIDIHDKNQVSALLAKFSNKKSATTLQNTKLDKSNVNVMMNFDSKKTVKLEPSVELVFENVDGLGVNIQSINYTAFTTCDPMGEVSSTITYKHN